MGQFVRTACGAVNRIAANRNPAAARCGTRAQPLLTGAPGGLMTGDQIAAWVRQIPARATPQPDKEVSHDR